MVLLKYNQTVGPDKYRLAKITETHPDKHNIVRTVTVALRDLKKIRKEKRTESKAPQTQLTVGIQRLVVILPVEENWVHGLTNHN